MRPDNPMRKFDPRKVAHYEKENYVAYYEKDWLKLLRVSVGLVRESFKLSWLQSLRGAYLVAQAEIAFAPFPDNNVPVAEAYMRQFYQLIKDIHREDINVERAAHLEVNWWSVHRRLFGNKDNAELAQALATLYADAYGVDIQTVQSAAALRAEGMLYSDLWVNAGKPAGSPLLAQEEAALFKSYTALKNLITAGTA